MSIRHVREVKTLPDGRKQIVREYDVEETQSVELLGRGMTAVHKTGTIVEGSIRYPETPEFV